MDPNVAGTSPNARPALAVGDRVRHRARPEWGIGTVTRQETVTLKGARDQRLWIRFPNAGTKTILRSAADLERQDATSRERPSAAPHAPREAGETLVDREAARESGWLGAIAKRKPEEAMTSLPATATDPFIPLAKRLEFVLALYRFGASPDRDARPRDSTGHGSGDRGRLIDWAVAHSGLDDPLSRFSRHELEELFRRYAFERDAILVRLVGEARRANLDLDALAANAPPAARSALHRINAAR